MSEDRSDLTHTVDGVQITPGLWVWDYNLDSVQVDPAQFPGQQRHSPITGVGSPGWDGWYNTLHVDGTRASLMNGTRMTTVFEGLRAVDYPGMAYGDAKGAAAAPAQLPLFNQFSSQDIETALHTLAELYANSDDNTGDYLSEKQQATAERVMHAHIALEEA